MILLNMNQSFNCKLIAELPEICMRTKGEESKMRDSTFEMNSMGLQMDQMRMWNT